MGIRTSMIPQHPNPPSASLLSPRRNLRNHRLHPERTRRSELYYNHIPNSHLVVKMLFVQRAWS
ncbi:hypothetical protein BD309DRAFT_949863 [Dichomitus squalens]|nr:hypothetical protein BD309DRAFT_949863 [Dichomitus squalens]